MGLRLPTVSVLDPLCGQECSGLLDAAVENRWLEINPMAVDKAKVLYNRVVQRRIYLAPQEIKTIAEQMDVANTIVVYLLADTGCPSARPWPCGAGTWI
ncbi:hypothetical protein J3T91_01110 [Bifidobacterium sp. B4001]|uniref:hypothetical protein n=1 Tax=unclassified Bifidobacterium TaxID=2608897 RepID=UPI00226B037C|nr:MULTISPECIES: hypothetical protein [unclassified Bifidobacterium]MCX8672122.1 hypothetical protein [Bifidobacterium sp. B4079]MCX8680555.1 hypothetical protein [Bifidobacterium sp. B4001]